MTLEEFSNAVQGYELYLVCGLYKSGTSLLTGIIQSTSTGVYNPSTETNPDGQGLSWQKRVYETNECKVLVELNKQVLNLHSDNDIHFHIIQYLKRWQKNRLVLKDPTFVYSLNHWIQSAQILNRNTIVLFTERNKSDILRSWKVAPYTSSLIKTNGVKEIDKMIESQNLQVSLCQKLGVDSITFTFEQIKDLAYHIDRDKIY